MSTVLRSIVILNLVLAGLLFLEGPLSELARLPEASLALLIRHVAGFLHAGVELISRPARIWFLVSTPFLLALLVFLGVSKALAGVRRREEATGTAGEGRFWVDAFLVAIWLAVLVLDFGYRRF
ncbi:MAG: hypothetical protein ACRD2Q_10530 [Terriglobales bacterium]